MKKKVYGNNSVFAQKLTFALNAIQEHCCDLETRFQNSILKLHIVVYSIACQHNDQQPPKFVPPSKWF